MYNVCVARNSIIKHPKIRSASAAGATDVKHVLHYCTTIYAIHYKNCMNGPTLEECSAAPNNPQPRLCTGDDDGVCPRTTPTGIMLPIINNTARYMQYMLVCVSVCDTQHARAYVV